MAARVSGGIFISYRRQETGHLAGRLRDRLADRFGESQVFIDVDAIEPGVDFAEEIFRAVTACTVLLAIIGPAWLTAADGRGRRRLDDPNDIVRLEIETALARGLRVIPILVDGAVMPTRGDLPGSLAGLAGRNALRVRHESFGADAGRLVTVIERVLAAASGTTVVSGAGGAPRARSAGDALNERLGSAAEQLGSDKPAVRLAGVHAMAGLADDWEENRQTCIDMLCDYLRMPHPPDSGSAEERRQFLADQEVRHRIIRVITERLGEDARASWNGKVFDFTGVILYGGDFSGARFNRGKVNFTGAEFKAGNVDFSRADFSGAEVLFDNTIFSGGTVSFSEAKFRDGFIRFSEPRFAGSSVYFHYAEFSGGTVRFDFANIAAGVVSFGGAKFSGGDFHFMSSGSSGGKLNFGLLP
jgi:TIR domain/Pentapeptide repeats (9 copies)